MPLPSTRGAPLTLTVELADSIAAEVAQGVPLEDAADARGVPRSTVYHWLSLARDQAQLWPSGDHARDESTATCTYFLDVLTQARGKRGRVLALVAQAATDEGTKEAAIRSKAALDVLRSHPAYRSRWGQTLQVSHNGTVHHQHQLDSASTEELQALAGWDDTPALPEPPSA